MNSIISDEVNRQSNAIAKRREQLRRWDESETNKESSNTKYSQQVKFCQSYIFFSACSEEDKDQIEYLLQNGIDINTSNIDGLTALHQSSIDNNLNMVKYLINQNADINCQDNEGWTPLHAAASSGNIEIVKYLLNIGASVDICNNEGQLPIDITEDKDIISILENDIKIKGIDYQQSKDYEHQLMIKHAQDFIYNNHFKSTPDSIVHITTGAKALHVAAAKGYLDVIELLIRAGANINSIDNDGWTPLHAAAHWNQHHVIKYFIEKNADLDTINYAGQTPLDVSHGETFLLLKQLKEKQSTIKNKSQQTIIDENLNHLQRSLNLYSKTNQDQSLINQSSQGNNSLQSLTTKYFNYINDNSSNVISSSPSQSLDSKINLSNNNETQLEITPRRLGTNDQTVGDTNNSGPYVHRRSGNETNPSVPSTTVSVTSCLPPSTTNVTVRTSSNSIEDSKKRINRDEEAEAQRKHRSSQARRERRSTLCVNVDDIKTAEQQIKNRSNEINELLNNKIGAPSTPLTNNEHQIQTDRLQNIIQDKKDKLRTTNGTNQQINMDLTPKINSRIILTDDITTTIANDSLNINDYQQSQRRTNRLNNQTKNTAKIIWNNETKEVEILDENKLDNQQSTINNSNHLKSTFENNKSFRINNSLSINPTIIKLYQQTKIIIEELNQKVEQLEKDIYQRDQIIEKLKTYQYIESSMDKRDKRTYERKIEELEQQFKKIDSFKCDNIRLKEENKALIRVISKLSK